MKKFNLALLALLVSAFAAIACTKSDDAPQEPPKQEPTEETTSSIELRLLCYNVRNCVGLDDKFSPERIAKIIKDNDVEAVALQELDSVTKRHPVDVLGELAELTGMYPTFGPSIDHQGGKYGIGVLTKQKPISSRRVPLPCRSEPRSLLIVELQDYYYCSTHLSLHEADRITSMGIIISELSKLNKPVILAGDFNDTRNSKAMKLLATEFYLFPKGGNANTFPADKPKSEIDFVALYTGKGAKATLKSHTVLNCPVESDHRPIYTKVEVKW